MTTEKVKDAGGHSLTILNYKGDRMPNFPLDSIQRMETFVFRDEDVLILAYPKSGTHWAFEVIRMLMQGRTDVPVIEKEDLMIEIDETDIASMPSPRLLNTHVLYRQLPGLRTARCKVIYITRNPRDVAVSFYNHHVKLKDYYHYQDGLWQDYFHLFVDGQLDYGSWFDYTRDWERVFSTQTNLDVLHVSYEDMKENSMREAKRMSQFLGQSHDDTFIQSVCDKCSFKSMAQRKGPIDLTVDGQAVMYRKGEVGDWQNWFTPEQVERMEEVYWTKMAGSSHVVRYTLSKSEPEEKSVADGSTDTDTNSNVQKK